MASTSQVYDTLASETTSISRRPAQQDNQLQREKASPVKASPKAKSLRSSYSSRLWMSWKWESAACFLILTTPIIIFATLYPHSGQPLPQWPFKVSINSLLSVYALVLKAVTGFILTSCIGQLQWTWFSQTRPLTDMLYYDSATRGADGALGLIWRQRFRQPLTLLGCITLVLVVTVDPFVQQLVRPVDCSIELLSGDGIATLPRANVFVAPSDSGLTDTSEPMIKQKSDWMTSMEVENALHEGMHSPQKDPPWRCTTGNCTFPEPYGSIGICYSCQDNFSDVTTDLTLNCTDTNSSHVIHQPKIGADCPGSGSLIYSLTTTYTDDKNHSLDTNIKYSISEGYTAELASAGSELWPNSYYYAASDSLHFEFLMGATANDNGSSDGTAYEIDDLACDSKESASSWSCQGYGAATCSLHPCVQIYDATITSGSLEERLVDSSSDTSWGMVYDKSGLAVYLALIDTHCSAEINTPTNSNSSMGSRWLPYNFNLSDTYYTGDDAELGEVHFPNDTTFLLESGCLYLANAYEVLYHASTHLGGTVEGFQFKPWGSFSGEGGLVTIGIEQVAIFEGPEVVRGMFNRGHTDFDRVQSIIANISHSLTTYIRTHGSSRKLLGSENYSIEVQGAAYHYATCLKVQWPWLVLPASLSILTTFFFLVVVGTTTDQGVPVWKASPLAWLLRAESPGNGVALSSGGSCKAMKERSRQIAVHVSDEDPNGPRIGIADLKDPNML